jgi:hypothetical protein
MNSMSDIVATNSPIQPLLRVPSPEKTLRQLFLTLFLRGRSSRGLKKATAPTSVGKKLARTLATYAAAGLLAFMLSGKPVFALAIYLHALTFVFLGMFVASSAGEILFNKEEADILLHRPIEARSLLWAKVRVLVEVSLWLAGAFNLAGFIVGVAFTDGSWRFLFAHVISVTLEAMFCTGSVVMMYQLCLRWFGRERLDGLMTTAQVLVSIAAVLSGQLLPQIMFRIDGVANFNAAVWWVALLPPAWFAGFDDALAGSGARGSWLLAFLAVAITAVVLWLAFSKLSADYESGLQSLGENVSRRRSTSTKKNDRRRWIENLVDLPPLRWWLRDGISRASFLLVAAYLVRDRDVKLRVYPAMAPILVMPVIMLARGMHSGGGSGFGIVFVGTFVALIPMTGVAILQFSQQWQAADIFRSAPIVGPYSICSGARRAVLCFLAFPVLVALAIIVWLVLRDASQLVLLIPGAISLPIFAMIPNLGGHAIPLSHPTEEAKSTGRGLEMMGAMIVAAAISGISAWAKWTGWFWWFVLGEIVLVIPIYFVMRASLSRARWDSME